MNTAYKIVNEAINFGWILQAFDAHDKGRSLKAFLRSAPRNCQKRATKAYEYAKRQILRNTPANELQRSKHFTLAEVADELARRFVTPKTHK